MEILNLNIVPMYTTWVNALTLHSFAYHLLEPLIQIYLNIYFQMQKEDWCG